MNTKLLRAPFVFLGNKIQIWDEISEALNKINWSKVNNVIDIFAGSLNLDLWISQVYNKKVNSYIKGEFIEEIFLNKNIKEIQKNMFEVIEELRTLNRRSINIGDKKLKNYYIPYAIFGANNENKKLIFLKNKINLEKKAKDFINYVNECYKFLNINKINDFEDIKNIGENNIIILDPPYLMNNSYKKIKDRKFYHNYWDNEDNKRLIKWMKENANNVFLCFGSWENQYYYELLLNFKNIKMQKIKSIRRISTHVYNISEFMGIILPEKLKENELF